MYAVGDVLRHKSQLSDLLKREVKKTYSGTPPIVVTELYATFVTARGVVTYEAVPAAGLKVN